MLSCQTSCKLSDFGGGFSTATAVVISLNKTALKRFGHSFYRPRNNPQASPIRFLRPELQLSIVVVVFLCPFPLFLHPSGWILAEFCKDDSLVFPDLSYVSCFFLHYSYHWYSSSRKVSVSWQSKFCLFWGGNYVHTAGRSARMSVYGEYLKALLKGCHKF